MLRFSDGISIDTSGELRILTLADGIYVVGDGNCIPVIDMIEANILIERLKNKTITAPINS